MVLQAAGDSLGMIPTAEMQNHRLVDAALRAAGPPLVTALLQTVPRLGTRRGRSGRSGAAVAR
jgi:hypothetical protein